MLIKRRLEVFYCCESMKNVMRIISLKKKKMCVYLSVTFSDDMLPSQINYCPFCGKEIRFDVEDDEQ